MAVSIFLIVFIVAIVVFEEFVFVLFLPFLQIFLQLCNFKLLRCYYIFENGDQLSAIFIFVFTLFSPSHSNYKYNQPLII